MAHVGEELTLGLAGLFRGFLRKPQLFRSPLPFVSLDGKRDQICDGSGEILFLHGPFARRTHVFVTHDPIGSAALPDGRVHHRCDSGRCQVGCSEFVRAQIVLGIFDGDCPACLQSPKVLRILSDNDLRTFGVPL